MLWPLFFLAGYHALPSLFVSTPRSYVVRRFYQVAIPALLLALLTSGGTSLTPQEDHLLALFNTPYKFSLYGYFAPLLGLFACEIGAAFLHTIDKYFFTMPWKRRSRKLLWILPLCFIPYFGSPLAFVLGLLAYKSKWPLPYLRKGA